MKWREKSVAPFPESRTPARRREGPFRFRQSAMKRKDETYVHDGFHGGVLVFAQTRGLQQRRDEVVRELATRVLECAHVDLRGKEVK